MKFNLRRLVAALMGIQVVRAPRVRDVAYLYRMGAGFPGDVNREHPFSVEPDLISAARPPTAYGQFVTIDTVAADNSVRPFAAGDTALTDAWGVTVRPFPTQSLPVASPGAPASLGAGTPPTTGVTDTLRWGYIFVQLNVITAAPKKGDPVFIWCAATAGAHVQGGVEVAASGGNTAALSNARYMFNGPPDANGVAEIYIR